MQWLLELSSRLARRMLSVSCRGKNSAACQVYEWLLLVGAPLLVACAAEAEEVRLHSAEELEAVTLRISGGTCALCWRELTVEAPGELWARDDKDDESFRLSTSEYESVADLVTGHGLQREIAEAVTWPCSLLLDVEAVVEVLWSDGASQEALLSDGCFGRCDELEHPLMALKRLLFHLKERYMQPLCPANADRYPEYCGIAPEPPPPPEARMLCAVCLDDCGVPLPEGTPERRPVVP
jgi:hypothetical protein